MILYTVLILFINIFREFQFSVALSACYGESNKARFCQPNFINVAHYATAVVGDRCLTGDCKGSETSGGPSDTASLFDRHMRGRETCWQSTNLSKSQTVNVTINLDKLYEAYYVTIEFCKRLPESIALFKSSDYGKTWHPWHFFSSSCKKSFRMRQTSTTKMERHLNLQKLTPVCFSLARSLQVVNKVYQVVPFNPMIGRNSISQDSMAVKDWTSLTNLRISMVVNDSNRPHIPPLAISDITIGGRVQCFGHALQIQFVNKSSTCDCHHKTDGPQCNKCLSSHNDQPWKPIFSSDSSARECQSCFCNNHAVDCIFDLAVYTKSNGIHGSRCINCLHQTTGPNCEVCSPGFYRNAAYPISHKKACQECKCHTIGTRPNVHCNPANGKCSCKAGVEGVTCNKCKKGYHQTRSSLSPCEADLHKRMISTEEKCEPCGKNMPRIKFKKFCRQHILMKVSVQSKEVHGDWTRFGVQVEKIWRMMSVADSKISLHESEFSTYPIWVENYNIRCNCSNFELGRGYLLLTKMKQKNYLNQPELVVDRKSMVLKWRDSWFRRLDKFTEREKLGRCERHKNGKKQSRRMFQNDNSRYKKGQ